MFTKNFINNNFLSPNEDNHKILIEKIECFLGNISKNNERNTSVKPRKINFKNTIDKKHEEIPVDISSTKDVANHLANIFQGSIRWHSPHALLNIAPPPILDTVAAATISALYNQNSLWDLTSGNIVLYEKRVIKALCELVNWDFSKADGICASGGKATLLYAIKIGLHKCNINIIEEGITQDYYVIASDRAHYSLEDVCNYLGIGTKNLIRISTNDNGQINIKEFEQEVDNLLKKGKKIACIILNCGVTIDMCVDPITDIKQSITILTKKYNLPKRPHLHADSVAGWAWLFFKKELDLEQNSASDEIIKCEKMYSKIKFIEECDSFSADFHKTGLAPYCSTFFISKEHNDIFSITHKGESNLKSHSEVGDFHVHFFTLENSRSSVGIISAWVAIQKLGYSGFQKYLIKMLSIGEQYKKIIKNEFHDHFHIINPDTLGFETLIKFNFFGDNKCWSNTIESSNDEITKYTKCCYKLKEYLYKKIFGENISLPLIGFVPLYKKQTSDPVLPCFLLYPMSVYTDENDIVKILNLLVSIKLEFEDQYLSNDILNNTDQIQNKPLPPR